MVLMKVVRRQLKFKTKIPHMCLKLMILVAIASMPTSREGTTEFPALFALLK